MTREKLMLIGGGRHALEIFYLLESLGREKNIIAFIQDEAVPGMALAGRPILAREAVLAEYRSGEMKPQILGAIGSIADNKRLVTTFRDNGFTFFSAIDNGVYPERQKNIGEGVTIAQNTMLTANITIGDHAIVNIGCNISHDVVIGAYTIISPGVNLAGHVVVEDEVFIGIGASIIPRVRVGRGAYIAAGACVTKDVPPRAMVAGVPAVIKKYL